MKCISDVPSLEYREFSKKLHNNTQFKRIPLDGTFELTFRCNLKCKHCYCNQLANDKKVQKQELSTGEIFRIFDEITEAGCFWLLITGGEPLLRGDFEDIYIYAKKKGMLITLFTNGTLINLQVADMLQKYPPFLVEITVYGANAKTYEQITGVPGSFTRCIKGIKLLNQKKVPLRLKTMVMKENYSEFKEIKKMAEDFGLKFRFDSIIHPRLDGSKAPCSIRLSPDEVVNLDLLDEKRVDEFRKSYQEFTPAACNEFVYNCGAGVDMFNINPYGSLQVCQMVTNPYVDLKKEGFVYGWQEVFPKIRLLNKKDESPCTGCIKQPLCARCPKWSELESGYPEAKVEYLCQVANLREEVFGLKQEKLCV